MISIEAISKWRCVDSLVDNAGTYIDVETLQANDASFPREVVGILANRDKDGATTFNIRCTTKGGNNILNLRFTVGEMHYIPVKRIYREGTGGKGLHVFGIA